MLVLVVALALAAAARRVAVDGPASHALEEPVGHYGAAPGTRRDELPQCCGGDRPDGLPFAGRSPVYAQHGAVATSQPLATEIAMNVLRMNGTAADAAIAANAALGLMEPVGCGVGGDLFAIVWDPKTRKLHGLNASGRSPRGQTLEELQARLEGKEYIPRYGCLSVSVPGAVDGWFELHDKFGRLPMAELLAPAIEYARDGFPMSPIIGAQWKDNVNLFVRDADQIDEIENMLATFTINGTVPAAGEIFRNPDLAATLEAIAEGGRDAFYRGPLSKAMDAYFERLGCPIRESDLNAHTSEWVDPAHVNYRGYDVYELPPNPQGIAALQMLNIMEEFDVAGMGFNSADYLHLSIEAKKLAFEDRARFYADPDFSDVPLEGLLSKDYAAARRRLISMDRAMTDVGAGDPRMFQGDTIYMTAADKDGMMVSFIQSNYRGMGSGLIPDGLGFMLQNRGEMFNLDPAHPNVYAPGKRPFHTIIPAFVTRNGEPFLSFGLMGGAMQPMGHVQIICNIVDFGMDTQEAGDAARWYHDGSTEPTGEPARPNGGGLSLEAGVPNDVRAELERRGHNLEYQAGVFGGYQAILWNPATKVYQAATEMRKDGMAAGF